MIKKTSDHEIVCCCKNALFHKEIASSSVTLWCLQGIIQEFNLGVGSHVSITLWCELYSWGDWGRRGRGHGCCNPPLLILLYITTWLYILIYTILLYILFFKTIIFFPKFNFLASYNSSFLKSNLAIFWVEAQIRRPKPDTDSILVCIIPCLKQFLFTLNYFSLQAKWNGDVGDGPR